MRTLAKLIDLKGRKALVTGAAGHIGRAVSEALVELGAKVAVLDRERRSCDEETARLCRLRAGSAIGVACDLMDEEATRDAVRRTAEAFDGLGILVHCAGYVGTTDAPGWTVPFSEQSVASWNDALQVNLTSAFTMVQEAGSSLQMSGHGSVVVFGSIYGLVGPDNRIYDATKMATPAGYAASKGGLVQLTRYLATTLAPGVRVTAVSPGGVWRGQEEIFHERYKQRTPLGRMASEEDLVGAAVYLASDLSEYVTGHNIVVDGGWTAW